VTALRLAHRGDWRRAPENTLPALLAALAVPGCDGLEFDVRIAADGLPVLLHDVTLARVQGRPERVGELDAGELAELGVPRLADALAAVGDRPYLNVELKGDEHDDPTARALLAARGERPARAVVSSFTPRALVRMGDLLPSWPRWLNAYDLTTTTVDQAVRLGCQAVSVRWRVVDRRTVARARAAGLEVAAWTVRRRPTYRRLERLGVVAICVEGAALDGE